MKLSNSLLSNFRLMPLLLGMMLILLAPAANAVTKHLSMVGENGQPMASTTITIMFPDGTKKTEVTDEKGIHADGKRFPKGHGGHDLQPWNACGVDNQGADHHGDDI